MALAYLSKTPGIGGKIKQTPQDFRVEEIMASGAVLEIDQPVQRLGTPESGQFLYFVLQKTDWTTTEALRTIAKRLRMSFRRFNFAGSKDKTSISTQLCSGFALRKEMLESLRAKDIRINGMWYANDKIRLGQLLGNRFTIHVDEIGKDAEKAVKRIGKELGGRMPNYFGEQRFGSTRRNTHIVGEKIIRNQMQEAAWSYLTDSEGEQNEQAKTARALLREHHDFPRALKEYPQHLHYERMLLEHLARQPGDYANAFRRLPRNLLLLFIHAFQADLFNRMLSERLVEGELKPEEGEYFCGTDEYGFPDLEKRLEMRDPKPAAGGRKPETGDRKRGIRSWKQVEGRSSKLEIRNTEPETGSRTPAPWLVGKLIGHETILNERERKMVGEAGIATDAFRMRHLPEIHSAGTYRALLVPLKDFRFTPETSMFRFSLPAGSYATVAMREFLEKKD